LPEGLKCLSRRALVGVGVVDTGRRHPVQLLAVPGRGVGQVDDIDDLGTVEAGDLGDQLLCAARWFRREAC
jgi:hypothetical protein